MSTYFDSRDPACKSPFGAVSCGTEVSFAVFCSPEEEIIGGELRIFEEFAGKNRTVPLHTDGGAFRCSVRTSRRVFMKKRQKQNF